MTESDIDALAELRVRGWQFGYRGLVPQHCPDAPHGAGDIGAVEISQKSA